MLQDEPGVLSAVVTFGRVLEPQDGPESGGRRWQAVESAEGSAGTFSDRLGNKL
jgi:hypothetical protein